MATINLRVGGSPLSNQQVDDNFTNLNTELGGKQASSTRLTEISALSPTNNSFIVGNGTAFALESASAARSSLGLGTIATQASSSISVAGGTINSTSIGASTRSTGAFTALTSNGATTFTGNISSDSTSTGTLVVTGGVGISGNLNIAGDLSVSGTTTTINSTTVSVDDKNIELGSIASPTNTTADGGGITLKATTDKTFNWFNSTDSWTSNVNLSGLQLISTVASGTSPLVVTSTQLVTNLNSDLLDGQQGTWYQDWTNTTNKPDPVITVTLSGAVTGTANTTLTNLASGTVTIATSISSLPVTSGGTGVTTSTGTGSVVLSTSPVLTTPTFTTSFTATAAAGPLLSGVAATSIVPTLIPNKADTNTGIGWVSADLLSLVAGGVSAATISSSGTVTAIDFNATSDRNLKENITPVENALAIINSLNGYNFKWKNSGKDAIGVIAQEVEELLPQIVHTNSDGIKSVSYDSLIPILIEAIKELSKNLK